MKTIKITLGIIAICLAILTVQSCGKQEKESVKVVEMAHDNSDGHHHIGKMDFNENQYSKVQDTSSTMECALLVMDYLNLRNALVADNKEKANEIAGKMAISIQNLEINFLSEDKQKQIKKIIKTSKRHVEHIAISSISHQREHFKDLSVDMISLISILGTKESLYKQHCPSYKSKEKSKIAHYKQN